MVSTQVDQYGNLRERGKLVQRQKNISEQQQNLQEQSTALSQRQGNLDLLKSNLGQQLQSFKQTLYRPSLSQRYVQNQDVYFTQQQQNVNLQQQDIVNVSNALQEQANAIQAQKNQLNVDVGNFNVSLDVGTPNLNQTYTETQTQYFPEKFGLKNVVYKTEAVYNIAKDNYLTLIPSTTELTNEQANTFYSNVLQQQQSQKDVEEFNIKKGIYETYPFPIAETFVRGRDIYSSVQQNISSANQYVSQYTSQIPTEELFIQPSKEDYRGFFGSELFQAESASRNILKGYTTEIKEKPVSFAVATGVWAGIGLGITATSTKLIPVAEKIVNPITIRNVGFISGEILGGLYATSVLSRTYTEKGFDYENLGRILGGETTPIILGSYLGEYTGKKAIEFIRIFGKEEKPIQEVVDEQILKGLRTYPTTTSKKALIEEFKTGGIRFKEEPETVYVAHATSEPFPKETITGRGSSEVQPAFYVAPKFSTAFLGINKQSYSLFGGNIFGEFNFPEAVALKPKEIKGTPKGIGGLGQAKAVSKFLAESGEQGIVYVGFVKTEKEGFVVPTKIKATESSYYVNLGSAKVPITKFEVVEGNYNPKSNEKIINLNEFEKRSSSIYFNEQRSPAYFSYGKSSISSNISKSYSATYSKSYSSLSKSISKSLSSGKSSISSSISKSFSSNYLSSSSGIPSKIYFPPVSPKVFNNFNFKKEKNIKIPKFKFTNINRSFGRTPTLFETEFVSSKITKPISLKLRNPPTFTGLETRRVKL